MNMESEMKERFARLESLIGKTADGQARLETLVGKNTDGQARLETLVAKTAAGHANLERLIVDVKESLETEMHSGFTSLNTKLDDISIRLDGTLVCFALAASGSSGWMTGPRRWINPSRPRIVKSPNSASL
jgi:ABC-type transporter Mla subunit MlaD